MNERGKSDSPVVPGKSPNNAGEPAAEAAEGRGLAKGNSPERNAPRTQSRAGVPSALERVRQAAGKDRKKRFTTLIHHVYFLGFSCGFRPRRSPHHALDALTVALEKRKVNWVLDADIRSFFDTLEHEWLVKLVEHRVADRRVVRLIQKWLNAGVLEDGKRTHSEIGTVQGGSVSPLLANAYLHYAFDLWLHQWRRQQRKGQFAVLRQTMRKRRQAKLKEVHLELRQRLHVAVPEQGAYLRAVFLGHMRYYGVPRNGPALGAFRNALVWLWWQVLKRRSQTHRMRWDRMHRYAIRWLPSPRICHTYPNQRLDAMTQGKSRMR